MQIAGETRKITEMETATTINNTDLFIVQPQNGNTKAITFGKLIGERMDTAEQNIESLQSGGEDSSLEYRATVNSDYAVYGLYQLNKSITDKYVQFGYASYVEQLLKDGKIVKTKEYYVFDISQTAAADFRIIKDVREDIPEDRGRYSITTCSDNDGTMKTQILLGTTLGPSSEHGVVNNKIKETCKIIIEAVFV